LLKNKEGHILPISELDNRLEQTLYLEDGCYIHNIPMEITKKDV
tara:strand:+ start:2487 stop:2618 length:132 start_codon:yes stop_codon:yes gene_type:complete